MLNDTPTSNAELARALGISPPMVHKLKGRGMPVHSLREALAWRAANLNPAQRKTDSPASPPVNDPPSRPMRVANDESFEQARTRKEIGLADQAEMDAAERRGELIEKARVKAELAKQFLPIREGLLNIPARLAPELHAAGTMAEVQTMLDREIRAVLAQYVGEA